MPYTFLMQYDAFVRPEYVKLLTEEKDPNMEIGVWVELAKEQVENEGKQTVWYNCKRYRANILTEKTVCF